MCTLRGERLLAQIADNNGVSIEEVIADVNEAIVIGCANRDPQAQAFWSQIPRRGQIPNAVELMEFLAVHQQCLARYLRPDDLGSPWEKPMN